jgi:hypothetical protein
MFKKLLVATVAVIGLAGAAQAQQPLFTPTVDGFCANLNVFGVTTQQNMRLICSSPRLKVIEERNLTAALAFFSKIPANVAVEFAARHDARQAEQAAYCRVAENPQLPPSPAMETCLAYWQDRTYAEIQSGEQLVAQQQARRVVFGLIGGVLQGLQAYTSGYAAAARMQHPPMYCNTFGGDGFWTTSCN